jgi:hypothetical protein
VVIDGDKEESIEKASIPALATADDMGEIKEALKRNKNLIFPTSNLLKIKLFLHRNKSRRID